HAVAAGQGGAGRHLEVVKFKVIQGPERGQTRRVTGHAGLIGFRWTSLRRHTAKSRRPLRHRYNLCRSEAIQREKDLITCRESPSVTDRLGPWPPPPTVPVRLSASRSRRSRR